MSLACGMNDLYPNIMNGFHTITRSSSSFQLDHVADDKELGSKRDAQHGKCVKQTLDPKFLKNKLHNVTKHSPSSYKSNMAVRHCVVTQVKSDVSHIKVTLNDSLLDIIPAIYSCQSFLEGAASNLNTLDVFYWLDPNLSIEPQIAIFDSGCKFLP